ncbi:hypothetical protein E2C01_065956 [Portunus trituberculatus]|uniref:Uncharacterized protein n=1 Tax=Portunus trituberculatus TaxID=210409 RepID=A0A5B7HFY0_PORTR|nr:hypothetical protein [Portunus trituberculatus]
MGRVTSRHASTGDREADGHGALVTSVLCATWACDVSGVTVLGGVKALITSTMTLFHIHSAYYLVTLYSFRNLCGNCQ